MHDLRIGRYRGKCVALLSLIAGKQPDFTRGLKATIFTEQTLDAMRFQRHQFRKTPIPERRQINPDRTIDNTSFYK